MSAPAVAVATMTLARSAAEEWRLFQGLSALAQCGWPTIVTDGGSAAAFVERLGRIRGLQLHQARGLVAQVATSIAAALAHGAPLLLSTEPDKSEFPAEHLDRFLTASRSDVNCLSVAMRSAASLHTYPGHQRHTESIINRRCGEMLGVTGDYSYGPFVMPSAVAQRLSALPPHLGWGWRPAAFALAHRLGYAIAGIEGHHSCPSDQREEDEADRGHRDRQLRENLEGLAWGLALPLAPSAERPADEGAR